MTKVETEYNNCIFALTLAQKGADEGEVNAEMHKSLDSLISAACSEGVAEGAEQERERITVIFDDYERHHCSPFLASIRQLLSLPIYDWHTHTSVLAPTKEKP